MRHVTVGLCAVVVSLLLIQQTFAEDVWLDKLDVSRSSQDWGSPRGNRSVDRHPIMLGGQKFEHGFGTHANGRFLIDLDGGSTRFTATVGVDDEVPRGMGSIVFEVYGDKRKLWDSGTLKGGDAPKQLDVDVSGVKRLALVVTDAGDGVDHDHADWADAKFTLAPGGKAPVAHVPNNRPPYILTPKPPAEPRINGAKLFGVRPGNPFLFTIAATGERPITFFASKLPEGLTLDAQTGRITGTLNEKGEHSVTLTAKNARGQVSRDLRIVCGDTIALTPPMGWNSWNCWATAVSDEKVRASADAMVSSGLIDHGWTYINIDDCWEIKPGSDDPMLSGPERGANGFINTNKKFPDMKALADYVHGRGLKIGLYSSPGPLTCGGYTASYQHEDQDAQKYAEWGFDYLKYDWCSYGRIAPQPSHEDLMKPYQVMRTSLDKQKRDIVFSLCQYGMGNVWEWGAQVGGNCWRTTGDITDTWSSMSGIGFKQDGHEKFAKPGHWNDPDMLVVGYVGWGPNLHPTKLTADEQYTHISLWCLLSSPLLIGCDMTRLDDFTLSLLTNDEVLAVNQDPLGKPAGRISKDADLEVWARDLEDGSKAVGLFNRGEDDAKATVKWTDLGISDDHAIRDLWRQKDVGSSGESYSTTVPAHGVVLVKISSTKVKGGGY
jgi:alpha-galactosidase